MDIRPVVMEGTVVRLEPLTLDHAGPLSDVGLDPRLWEWLPNPVATREEMLKYVRLALNFQEEGTALPFATVERCSGRVIGSTRYLAIERRHRRVEIGGTWVAAPWQRTAVNTEAKYLMLRHAFETLECVRVELKTDVLNERSRTAILRLGARQEGILRSHMITAAGRIRDTVYFSILREEWPAVRKGLEHMLSDGPRSRG